MLFETPPLFAQILLGGNALLLLVVLVVLVKQFLLHGNLKQTLLVQNQAREQMQTELARTQQALQDKLHQLALSQTTQDNELKERVLEALAFQRNRFEERQMEVFKMLHDTLTKGVQDNRQQVKDALQEYAKELGERVTQLTQTTESKLNAINQQVEKRLADGFEKTNATFGDVIKRLALIDAAQQKITELSTNVVSLQEILNDKRSRGAFGEIQLTALISNLIPEQHVSYQHTLSNGRRPDCMLFLPEPTGNIAIDAKFPLESFRAFKDTAAAESDRQQALKQFKIDIRKHIQDIAEKYIVEGETSDGALMFIPAEAVFAEIHAHHPDLVELAQRQKVWLVSPTTLMAVLTTARAVLKDAATRQQVHEIQKHLRLLADDFDRFQLRMDNLSKRIAQAHNDVEQVHISSRKISQRFGQIERADFQGISMDEEARLLPKEYALTTGIPASLQQ